MATCIPTAGPDYFTCTPIPACRDSRRPKFPPCPIPPERLEEYLRRLRCAIQRYWGDWDRAAAVLDDMRAWAVDDHPERCQTLAETPLADLGPEVLHGAVAGQLAEMDILTAGELADVPLPELAELRRVGKRTMEQIRSVRDGVRAERQRGPSPLAGALRIAGEARAVEAELQAAVQRAGRGSV